MKNSNIRASGSLVNPLNRRRFISGVAATAAAAGSTLGSSSPIVGASVVSPSAGAKFKLKFAPHPGSFRTSFKNNVLDEIRFCHDQGFTAIEYNRLASQPVEMQQKIGDLLAKLDMTMGVFIGYANFVNPTFAKPQQDTTNEIVAAMKAAVEVAKRVNAKWMTVVPGSIDQPGKDGNQWGGPRIAEGYQLANVIDMLRRCAEVLEPHELIMVLEPLNWETNHGGTILRYSDQAYAICRAVDSPSCKILFDIYHQQISEGNLIPNIDQAWNEIAYFQAGDNPGRNEPGTGEINYKNVFQYIHDRSVKEGKEFVIVMEHGNSIKGKAGEEALIASYRAVDAT